MTWGKPRYKEGQIIKFDTTFFLRVVDFRWDDYNYWYEYLLAPPTPFYLEGDSAWFTEEDITNEEVKV